MGARTRRKGDSAVIPRPLPLLALPLLLLPGAWLPLLAGGTDRGPIVPSGAKLEKLFDGCLVLSEGVAVAPDGQVYFSDITFTHVSRERGLPLEAGHIWRYDPRTGRTVIFRSPSGMSNGIKFDAEGNMIVA